MIGIIAFCALIAIIVTLFIDNLTVDDDLNKLFDEMMKIQNDRIRSELNLKHSIPEYLNRMEKLLLELQQQRENEYPYVFVLWWGNDGIRLNPDGTTEWITRKTESKPKPKVKSETPLLYSLLKEASIEKIESFTDYDLISARDIRGNLVKQREMYCVTLTMRGLIYADQIEELQREIAAVAARR